jgi:hypothetical protein
VTHLLLLNLLLILIGPFVAVAGPTAVAGLSWPDLIARLVRPATRTAVAW